MFVVHTPWHTTAIGIFDIAIIVLISEHWRRRKACLLVAVATGLIGLFVADILAAIYRGGMPPLPFVVVGWLTTQGWRWLRPQAPLGGSARPT